MCKLIVSQTHFLEVLREVKWVEHWTNDMTGRLQSEIGRPIEECFSLFSALCTVPCFLDETQTEVLSQLS